MHLGAAAEEAHLLAQLRLYQRVDDDRRTALGALDGELEVLHCLHPRMPDLLERLLRELRLERHHEPRSRLAGCVRDDVQLDRGGVHFR